MSASAVSSPRQAIATTPRERHARDGRSYTSRLRHFPATIKKKRVLRLSIIFNFHQIYTAVKISHCSECTLTEFMQLFM